MVEPTADDGTRRAADARLADRATSTRCSPPARAGAGTRAWSPHRRRGALDRLRHRHRGRTAAPLPAPLHRSVPGADDPRPEDRRVRHGDRPRAQGREATDPPPSDDGDRHARRRHRLPRPHVLQPAVAGLELQGGQEVAVSGIATLYRGRLQLSNQEVEFLGGDEADLVHTGRITPVHPASEGITTRTIRELIHRALERLPAHRRSDAAGADRGGGARSPTTAPSATSISPRTTARSRGAGAAEVRRAVHAGAGRGVPQASCRGRAARRRAQPGERAHRAAAGDAPVRADRRPAAGDGRDRARRWRARTR